MGSWGGAGFAALFGGLMAQNVGWRWIFFTSVAVSVAGLLMVHGTPESRATNERGYKFDTAGILPFMIAMVALEVFAAQGAGLLTLGYAVAIVAFIRVGEKLLRRLGPRRPMTWGCLIVGVSILLLMPTNVVLGTYKILAIVAFTLFGIGLGLYATPSTEAALFAFGANLLIDAAAIIAILLTVPKGRLREEPYE